MCENTCYDVAHAAVDICLPTAFAIADHAAASRVGVRAVAPWHKPDGTVVYFLCFEKQHTIVPGGDTFHVVGKAPTGLRRLKRTFYIGRARSVMARRFPAPWRVEEIAGYARRGLHIAKLIVLLRKPS